jgi:predicted  nucleic acid-binding Zn-ribbon protein
VPSAEAVAAEGVRLGEMNATLLQKVEELTLYAIEQRKRVKAQRERAETMQAEKEALRRELDGLREQVETLKQALEAQGVRVE